jgi:hypothetical protein
MQIQAYEGHFKNGDFYNAGRIIRFPEFKRAIITILDESVSDDSLFDDAQQALLEEIQELRGIVRSDIDEKAELAKARTEKYESSG